MQKLTIILLLLFSLILQFNDCSADWFELQPEKLNDVLKLAESKDREVRKEAYLLLWMHYVEKNNIEAIEWAKKGAELGNVQAMKFLFETFWDGEANGIVVKQDKNEAIKWLKMASDAGDELAQKAYKKIKAEQ